MKATRAVMSILGLHARRIGGIEVYCRELSQQLGQRGWSSVLVFLNDPSEAVRRFLDLPNVQFDVLEDSWKNSWKPIKDFCRLLRKYRPAVVHSQFTSFVGAFPWAARLFSVDRIFYTDQTSRPTHHTVRLAAPWKRLLAGQIDRPISKVFCVSDFVRRCLTERGLLPKERFEVLYNGIDLSRAALGNGKAASFRQQHGIPENRVTVCQVGQLITEKGVEDLLQAGKRALVKNRNLHFVLAGDGACQDQYVTLAETLGIADHVTFTGLVEDPMVDGLYDASHIVCQVSRWEEAFGFTIAEAMSAGKPVIGTRVGGIPEVIDDGETGYLVERGDVAGIADRILSLAEDPNLRTSMGRAGRRRCERMFDVRDQVRSLLAFYGVD